jgi:hypothetical protein
MSKDENGKMFQFLNNKINKNKDKKAKESIQKEIKLFETKVKRFLLDELNKSNENYFDQLCEYKEELKQKINQYFENYIKRIKTFYEKTPEAGIKYELNKNLTDEYDFKYFVEENVPIFDDEFEKLSKDFVKSTAEKICAKYDSIKTEIYFEKGSKNNQNGLESLNLLYENSKIIKAKKIIISNNELTDNENFPKLLISSSSTKIPSSNTILLEIEDLNKKYESKEMEESDYVKNLARLLKDRKLLSNHAHDHNIENRIKKILKWKTNEFEFELKFCENLSSVSKATIKDFDIEIFLELKLDFENEIDKFKINCDQTSYLKIEKKLKSLNEKQVTTRDENFQDENIALNPIFIWINFENLIQQKTINNIYNLLKNIVCTIDCDNFIVFLFIEKSDKNETHENTEKFKESFNKLLKAIESNHKDIKNSIVINLIEEKNTEVVRIKNYIYLFAKFLNLEKFYSISEKIETFYEYNNTLIDFKSKANSAVKALDFMAKVLSHSVYDSQEELSEDDLDCINLFELTLHRDKLIDAKDHIFLKNSLKNYKEDKNKQNLANNFDLLKKLRLPNKELIQQYENISNILKGKKLQYLSEIILAKKNKIKQNELIQLNKTCELYFTHKHAKPDFYDIILYNTKAIDSLFPIKKQSLETDHKSDEQDLFFYKLLRTTASCYVVCFYAYETNYLQYKKGLTEKQLLEWKLPNLNMPDSNDSTSDREIKLPIIKFWHDFDYNSHEINSSDQDYNIPYISHDKQEFKRESKLQSFIQDILINVFSNNIYSPDEIKFGPPDLRNKDADIVMTIKSKKGKVKRLIDIEVKNPKVLNALENTNLYDFYISSEQKNKKPLYCLKQIYEYMSINL